MYCSMGGQYILVYIGFSVDCSNIVKLQYLF
uniref:Uncharacterized protein n=1 Tax=Arundo donax TaxID=35708 RepID=A0A0A9F8J9_ARUDO